MSLGKRESGWDQSNGTDSAAERKRKRKSRWAQDESEKAFIPGMPTAIPPGLNKEQEEQYLLQLQIEEISRRLRSGDLGISTNPDERSPSPEPIYNNEGKRLNTREYRTRKKLEEQRHELVTRAVGNNPDYKPPADYKPPVVRVSDKVMIPQEKHPDINFVGLLIGPRGNTLKNLEKDTGAKIIIRGKGSVKEGKIGRKDGQPLPGEDEPLHAYITANNPENVKKAAEKIQEIILQGIEVPEGQNDLRRQQLRELALLNGTLRENDGLAKLKQLQQAQTIVTNTILCTICGGTGHIAQDCKGKRPGDTFKGMTTTINPTVDRAKMDSEYSALMAELGEGPPPVSAPPSAGPPSRQNIMNQPPPLSVSRPPFNTSQPPPPLLGSAAPSRPPPSFQTSQSFQMPPAKPPSLMSIQTTPISQSSMASSLSLQQNAPPQYTGHQQHQNQPPPQLGAPPQQNQPPPHQLGPPPQQNQPPPQLAPPPVVSSYSGAPPPQMGVPPPTSQAPNLPPWQQQPPAMPPVSSQTTHVVASSAPSMGVPHQNILSAPPPPPPPSSQQSGYPWQQQQQQPPPQPVGYGAPVSSSTGLPPWQQPPQQTQPPPSSMGPPPPVSQALPPWQQPQAAPVPPPPGIPQLHSAVPPPPPPTQQGRPAFNPIAPPPPPPGGTLTSLAGSIPLGVPPPPPPN